MFHLHVGGYLEGEFEWRRSDEDSKMKLHQMEGTQNQKHLKKGRKPINVASWPRPLSTGIWKCTSALHTASIMKLKVKVICWNIEKMQIENRKVFYMQTWLMLKWKIHVHFLGKTNSFADTENNLFTNAHLKICWNFIISPNLSTEASSSASDIFLKIKFPRIITRHSLAARHLNTCCSGS